jgi:TRAP-type C4-dicarboxylate transport system substrate-binding protein
MSRAFKMDRRSLLLSSTAAVGAVTTSGFNVFAQETITWKVVANTRFSSQFTVKWAWMKEELAKRTNGRFNLDVVSFAELGMTGAELIRMLSIGLIDAGEVVTGYVSGEVPIIEGAQIVGAYENLDQAQQAYETWLTQVVEPQAKVMGGKPISSLAFTTQLLWSKFAVNDLSDLKGKKIRVFAKGQADFFAALGATPTSIPITEVYSALERGVVDGAVTGAEVANGFKYEEVCTHVTDLLLGPGAGFAVVSQRAWDALPDDMRGEFEALLPEMRKMSWSVTRDDDRTNLEALISRGIKPTVPAKPEWVPVLKKIAEESVVPAWAQRVGPDGVAAFNKAIAPIVGFTIK